MPYKAVKIGDDWFIMKVDTGKLLGPKGGKPYKHPSKKKADAQIAAITKSEGKW